MTTLTSSLCLSNYLQIADVGGAHLEGGLVALRSLGGVVVHAGRVGDELRHGERVVVVAVEAEPLHVHRRDLDGRVHQVRVDRQRRNATWPLK